MPFDKAGAAKYVNQIALPKYGNHQCAHNVFEALDKGGGLNSAGHPKPAKDAGPSLVRMGFKNIGSVAYTPELGDVVVIQAIPGHPSGHMEIYDGKNWVSDFVQDSFFPAHSYEHARPPYAIYRYP